MIKAFWADQEKEHFAIILSGSLVCLVIIALLSIVALIVSRGLAHFWVQPAYFVNINESVQGQTGSNAEQFLVGRKQYAIIQNRDVASDKVKRVWLQESTYMEANSGKPTVVEKSQITYLDKPERLAKIGMTDGSFLLAIPKQIQTPASMASASEFHVIQEQIEQLREQVVEIQVQHLSPLHELLAEMRIREVEATAPAYIKAVQAYQHWDSRLTELQQALSRYSLVVSLADGREMSVPLADTHYMQYPNAANIFEKLYYFISQIWLFVSDSPKQAITAGGVFPALFGTVLMVMLMTIMVTPLGVLAAIYLAEYAPNNSVVSIIRIAVSNLAGVPSIVYGVFGLGFFVYTVGGHLDSLIFPEKSDVAVFGAPGLLWASLTMALLTLPVVIVSTEEGLRRVPRTLRQGSYALGATKFETIRLIVLPMATPGIMTGVILAIARGAGEVAPLLMLGAVKFALLLPIDAEFPYIHLERQFMHLGVLIYDGAFHSQFGGGEAGLMFAACMLLLVVVLVLNTIAVRIRNRLRNQYQIFNG
ncbi:phosphate ABC transporter permease PstA [Alteromonas sp. a30]|uniref:phosphate ABC transporter permease PstA n=1 Tax=Alteromonas sp. a30 TaxID=2730917 RepID=UPI002280E915|nr:phosphate ABC transporter permease PstA [Alteromonas sp. a30]MCY7296029.1 phosphate ABC transporter permease PstA [Alteromonas sp. a30]